MQESAFRACDKAAAAFGLGGQRSEAFRSIYADYLPFSADYSRFCVNYPSLKRLKAD
jgi:hypothetical protein